MAQATDTATCGISTFHMAMFSRNFLPLALHRIFMTTNMITGSISVPATRLRMSNAFFMGSASKVQQCSERFCFPSARMLPGGRKGMNYFR